VGLPPPNPRFPLRSACLAEGSLQRATELLAGGGFRPHTPAFRCARLTCRRLATTGNEPLGRWVFRLLAPLSASLGLSSRRLAIKGSETLSSLAGGSFHLHAPALRCARLVLQTARCRGQRTRPWQSRQISRVGVLMKWQLGCFQVTD
jgi:hypothetical protein